MWIMHGVSLGYAREESWEGTTKLSENIQELCWRNRPIAVTHCMSALDLRWEIDQLTESQLKDFG